MERLTRRFLVKETGEVLAYLPNSGVTDTKIRNKLGAYEDAEEQGLLLRLPCKVGDTIYKIPSKVNYKLNDMHYHPELNRVYEKVVYSVEMFNNDRYFIRTCDGIDGVVSDFYKETWFLTREEAEAALEKMKGEKYAENQEG